MCQEMHPVISLAHALPELEKEMAPTGGDPEFGSTRIHTNPKFLKWRAEIKYQLQQLKSVPIITETLAALDDFGGWNDVQLLRNIKANIETIASHLDDFII